MLPIERHLFYFAYNIIQSGNVNKTDISKEGHAMQVLPQQLLSLKEAAALLFGLLNQTKCSAIFASLQSVRDHILLYTNRNDLALAFPNDILPQLLLDSDTNFHIYPSASTLYYNAVDSEPAIQMLLKSMKHDTIALTICRLPVHQSIVVIATEAEVDAEVDAESGSELSQPNADKEQLHTNLKTAAQLLSHIIMLEHASITDDLTELYNKRFLTYLKATSAGQDGSIIFIDFNNFKQINDTYGHHAGDAVLKEAAARLKAQLRKTDQLIRYGGDEFIIYIQEKMIDSDLEALTDKLQAALSVPIQFEGNIAIDVSASFGFSASDSENASLEQLIKKADNDMYEEKLKKEL